MRRILSQLMAVAAALFSFLPSVSFAQQQPAQWDYKITSGVATATYAGNVVFQGGTTDKYSTSVLYWGAVGNGVTDDAAAFQAAINSLPAGGGIINVPGLNYVLNATPTWGTKSIIWNISPAAVFTGTGTGAGKFPYMTTNIAQLAVGPFIQSQSSQKSTNANGGIAAFNVEMLQPDSYGAGQSVALFAGTRTNNANPAGNSWVINTVHSVNSAATGTHQSIEVDVDVASAAALVKGISISGGGTQNPDVALEILRAAGSWVEGITLRNSLDAIVSYPIASSRGIVLNGVGSIATVAAGTAFTAQQYSNGNDTILLQRNTDAASTGYFIRAVNAANNSNLVLLSTLGDFAVVGIASARSLKMTPLAVASLPACNAGNEGALYSITDANSAVFNAAVAGGGSNHVMAYCNGTSWTVH